MKACIDAWAGMPSIKKSAAAPQGAAPADRRAADGVPGGAGEEDDDVPEITRTLTVDEVLAERRDIAMCALLVLSPPMGPHLRGGGRDRGKEGQPGGEERARRATRLIRDLCVSGGPGCSST